VLSEVEHKNNETITRFWKKKDILKIVTRNLTSSQCRANHCNDSFIDAQLLT